jgi:glycosyltransferase involved in cell wall biosynthesis
VRRSVESHQINLNDSASVVMSVYNGREFIADQLDSIRGQLRPSDELIVVDDASTDGSLQLLRRSDFPNIRVLTNPQNLGVIESFQRGLSLAQHDVVFLCDQDDLWAPGKRDAFMTEFTRDPAVCVVVSDAQVIDRDGRLVAPSFMAIRGGFNGTILGTLWRNRYLGCAMAVRRSVLKVALPFPSGVPMHDMWIGVVGRATGRVVYLRTPYVSYRRHGSNLTAIRSRETLGRRLRWRGALLLLLVQRLLSARFGMHKASSAL